MSHAGRQSCVLNFSLVTNVHQTFLRNMLKPNLRSNCSFFPFPENYYVFKLQFFIMCFRREIRPTSSEEACSIRTQLPTQGVGQNLGLTCCSPSSGWICPENNLLQCTVSLSAPKVDTCNSRGSLQTALGRLLG